MAAAFSVRLADYRRPSDAAALVMLLDAYASDPAGGTTNVRRADDPRHRRRALPTSPAPLRE